MSKEFIKILEEFDKRDETKRIEEIREKYKKEADDIKKAIVSRGRQLHTIALNNELETLKAKGDALTDTDAYRINEITELLKDTSKIIPSAAELKPTDEEGTRLAQLCSAIENNSFDELKHNEPSDDELIDMMRKSSERINNR